MKTSTGKVMTRLVIGSKQEQKWIYTSVFLTLFVATLDIITKNMIVARFKLHESEVIIENLFSLTYVLNYGAAFGGFQGYGVYLTILSILVGVGMVAFYNKICEGCVERYLALSLVLAGIIGNCSDRLFRDPAAVVDFLDFYIAWGGRVHHWPAFNVADMGICTGATILVISGFFRKDLKKMKTQS